MVGEQKETISPVEIFYSYAHKDAQYREELEHHLSLLRQQGIITEWHDCKIVPGMDRTHTIDDHLLTASIILLLISSDYLTSDYCYGIEMQRALERHRAGDALVIPILLRDVDWQTAPFAYLQYLPRNGRPVRAWRNRDAAFHQIVKELRQTIKDFQSLLKHSSSLISAPSSLTTKKPSNYVPFSRNPFFQPRPGEFERLEHLLFGTGEAQQARHIGLVGVGMVGMGGVGKTQLAVELAHRYQHNFLGGVFWMSATGTTAFDWHRPLAELAFNTRYLPPDDDVSSPENELRRAQYFCRYLAKQDNALLILDNVEDPNLVISALPTIAGGELACTILYTSRNRSVPNGAIIYQVEQLSKEGALHLLLEGIRSSLLTDVLSQSQDEEAQAARTVCQGVDYLPLALAHLRSLLEQDQDLKLVRLAGVLKQRGVLNIAKTLYTDIQPLFATFWLSWEKVSDKEARNLFKLASYFPESTPIPLWLLGIATGLGENGEIFEPLGKARLQLQKLSLMETLMGNQVRLHPLVREFGQMLVTKDDDKGKTLLEDAGKQIIFELADIHKLEQRAKHQGYWRCLEQLRAALEYIELLGAGQTEQLKWTERCLDHEGHLLGNREWRWWPELFPGLFYQQLYNRLPKEKRPLTENAFPTRWLRQIGQVDAEDKALCRVFAGHWGWVTSVAFSPDGSKILTGSREGLARFWESTSGKLLTLLFIPGDGLASVAFSPDGSKFLTGSFDGIARLWEVASNKLIKELAGHQDRVTSVAFSPDGSRILTGSTDRTAKLWEVADGRLLMTLEGHTSRVTSVAFSPDGNKAATGSSDSTGRLWDTINGLLLATMRCTSPLAVTSVAFSPDRTSVLTGSGDWTIRTWKTTDGQNSMVLQGHSPVTSVVFSPDGSEILSGFHDGIVQLWDSVSGLPLMKLYGHIQEITSVTFSPDGSKILTGSYDHTARLWEPVKERTPSPLNGHTDEVLSVAFSPDGTKAVTCSRDGTLGLWETISGKRIMTWNTGEMLCATFSPDGTKVLTGSPYGEASIWEATNGGLLIALKGYPSSVTAVAFSPNGNTILTGYLDGKVRLWITANGKLLKTLKGHSDWVKSVAFSPDGSKILATASNKTWIWEEVSGKLFMTLNNHREDVTSATFSLDGSKVLTSSIDKTAKLWDMTTGEVLATLEGFSQMEGVMFSPHNHLISTWDSNGYLFLWGVAGEEPLGLYVANHDIGAIHWKDESQVLLADLGGGRGVPNFHRLKLEGEW